MWKIIYPKKQWVKSKENKPGIPFTINQEQSENKTGEKNELLVCEFIFHFIVSYVRALQPAFHSLQLHSTALQQAWWNFQVLNAEHLRFS